MEQGGGGFGFRADSMGGSSSLVTERARDGQSVTSGDKSWASVCVCGRRVKLDLIGAVWVRRWLLVCVSVREITKLANVCCKRVRAVVCVSLCKAPEKKLVRSVYRQAAYYLLMYACAYVGVFLGIPHCLRVLADRIEVSTARITDDASSARACMHACDVCVRS